MSNRNPKRLAAIRLLPCVECGADAPSQAAHSNFGIHGKGRSIKAHDKYTIPLCDADHKRFDQMLMGMDRNQSLEWFNKKLAFIDEVLNDQSKDEASIF